MDTLGNMYAFGATLGYSLVFVSLIRLRFRDPYSPRPYKMPFNLKIRYQGRKRDLPGTRILSGRRKSFMFSPKSLLPIPSEGFFGPCWVVLCFLYYLWYRKKVGSPVFKTIKRDSQDQQKAVLQSAEEFELPRALPPGPG